jgi:protein-tyrosine kinase
MSRIHEALQKAYLERGKMPILDDFQVVDQESKTAFETPAPIVSEIDFDQVARYPWKPALLSLPTVVERGAEVEQFRSLRSHVYQARYDAPLKTILVASGMPSEGKSFIAANLAVSMARNSVHNVLLIDSDLRRPTLHTLLGAPNEVGLSDYLNESAEVIDILQRNLVEHEAKNSKPGGLSNLTFISSGKSTEHSTELVANGRMKELIASVSPYFDWIVIDAPPVLVVSDAVEIARAADSVLLVARAAKTPYEVAQRAQAAFSNSRVLGFVLNDIKKAPRSTAYGYGYNYYYYGESGTNGSTVRKS